MLQSSLQEDLHQAQLDKDEVKVSTLRLLLSEIKYSEIEKRQELSDEDILKVISQEVKKRKESIQAYKAGNREDLASKEEAEAAILQKYLPEQLSDEELEQIVGELIVEVGATTISQMGQVMGKVMAKVGSKADGGRVSSMVKAKLQNV